MKDYILYLKPILKPRIWGGNYLKEVYKDNSPDKIGEAWILSGHKEGDNLILNDNYQGMTLDELYLSKKELFGNSYYNKFPLLIKIIDAEDNLSVQVHPDDNYAKKYYNDFGKNECWYILESKDNSEIIYGHQALNKEDFTNHLNNNNLEEILNYIKVKKDDFFYVPVGTIHAIGKGIKILEIQQSSDVTFRLYDYNRLDTNNNPRELHIKESLEVINFNYKTPKNNYEFYHNIKRLVSNEYFTVDQIDLINSLTINNNDNMYSILYNKDANINIEIDNQKYEIKKNEAVLITALTKTLKLLGNSNLFFIKELNNPFDKLYHFK